MTDHQPSSTPQEEFLRIQRRRRLMALDMSEKWPEDTFADANEYLSTFFSTTDLLRDEPKQYEFLKWCIEDTVSTTGTWPTSSELWAYYHAAHVHVSNGPLA